jgi:hypothetical protein
MRHTMHLLPSVAKQPNLELKTRPKQLLGSLPLVIALPGYSVAAQQCILVDRTANSTIYGVCINKYIDPVCELTFASTGLYFMPVF